MGMSIDLRSAPLLPWSLYRTYLDFHRPQLMGFFSLGNAAIFLIGGLTRSVQPLPILLRSGDIIVMSGPGCRRAYHGEPSYIKPPSSPHCFFSIIEVSLEY